MRQRGEPAAGARTWRASASSRCARRSAPAARASVRQLLTESLLLGAGGALGGLLVAIVGIRGLTSIAPVTLPRLEHAVIDARVLAFTRGRRSSRPVLFGLVPAWRGGAAEVRGSLAVDSRGSAGGRPRPRGAHRGATWRSRFVLLAGAGLMLRTVAALTRVNPGFTADGS